MQAYCVKCREKREIVNSIATFTKTGQPATSGKCVECGTGVFRIGKTELHQGLQAPPKVKSSRRRKKTKAVKRKGKVVIVESPAKARSIGRFLGKGYKVKFSLGHVRDLLKSRMAVDPTNHFEVEYRVPNDKRPIVKDLKKDVQNASEVYLATDLDREGEAIAWHLAEVLEVESERLRRVTFHEITRDAINRAFETPRKIDMSLVEAQETRRILDRLVGFSLSELLWKKVAGRLSAGRVQSVAVRLIVERQRAIDSHVAKEYWGIRAKLFKNDDLDKELFESTLRKIDNMSVGIDKEFYLKDESTVKQIVSELEGARWLVKEVKHGQRRRKPPAPFRTSTLQQEASRKLNFPVGKTMAIAQQLYQGDGIQGDHEGGLITYMRTDSVQVSPQAESEVRNYIEDVYGVNYLPNSAPKHRKTKSSQEAHEAIRPTSVLRSPSDIKESLSSDQYKLYNLIWTRFVSSQMAVAVFDTLRVDILAIGNKSEYEFRATGDQIKFDGFLKVYDPSSEDDSKKTKEQLIPDLHENEVLQLECLISDQKFTKPPPLFTEASLVKALEEHGIGRPSTYAPTLSTIVRRGYVSRDNRRLCPTDIGITVNDLLVEFFSDVLDIGFTATMEGDLDFIAQGKREREPVLNEFWVPFEKDLVHAHDQMPTIDKTPESAGRDCPKCGEGLLIRTGRFGKFIGCSGFPECRHTEQILHKIGVRCPDCSDDLVQRKTRKGRVFYGCVTYPKCEWTSWVRPLVEKCKECEGILFEKGKNKVTCSKCEQEWDKSDIQSQSDQEYGTKVALQ